VFVIVTRKAHTGRASCFLLPKQTERRLGLLYSRMIHREKGKDEKVLTLYVGRVYSSQFKLGSQISILLDEVVFTLYMNFPFFRHFLFTFPS